MTHLKMGYGEDDPDCSDFIPNLNKFTEFMRLDPLCIAPEESVE